MPLNRNVKRLLQQATSVLTGKQTDQAQTISTLQQTLQTMVAAAPAAVLMEELTGTLGADGSVVLATTKPFTAAPFVLPVETWAGLQLVAPYVTAKTASQVTVKAKRSKGTLVLTAGPFEDAPAGTVVKVFVVGV